LKVCENANAARTVATPSAVQLPAAAAAPPAAVAAVPAAAPPAPVAKEARLRELKHFYEEGLVTEDVYRERQIAILGEP
jgi:hypothetical protein